MPQQHEAENSGPALAGIHNLAPSLFSQDAFHFMACDVRLFVLLLLLSDWSQQAVWHADDDNDQGRHLHSCILGGVSHFVRVPSGRSHSVQQQF